MLLKDLIFFASFENLLLRLTSLKFNVGPTHTRSEKSFIGEIE